MCRFKKYSKYFSDCLLKYSICWWKFVGSSIIKYCIFSLYSSNLFIYWVCSRRSFLYGVWSFCNFKHFHFLCLLLTWFFKLNSVLSNHFGCVMICLIFVWTWFSIMYMIWNQIEFFDTNIEIIILGNYAPINRWYCFVYFNIIVFCVFVSM